MASEVAGNSRPAWLAPTNQSTVIFVRRALLFRLHGAQEDHPWRLPHLGASNFGRYLFLTGLAVLYRFVVWPLEGFVPHFEPFAAEFAGFQQVGFLPVACPIGSQDSCRMRSEQDAARSFRVRSKAKLMCSGVYLSTLT